MKIIAVLLLAISVHLSAKTHSQTISLKVKNGSLKDIFLSVEKQTGFLVFYNKQLISHADPVTVTVESMPLADFMKLVLKGRQLDFYLENKTIFIKRKLPSTPMQISLLEPQQPPVKIKVTDIHGRPLAGASVINKKSGASGTTGADGQFTMTVNTGDQLEISFVGFQTIRMTVKDSSGEITVKLNVADISMQEVVVNKGYYATTQRLNTGAVSKVTAEEIEKQPVANPILALQGKAPGVQIAQISGSPGGTAQIKIRGDNSMSQGSSPLFIIDGVPFSPAQRYNGAAFNLMSVDAQSAFNLIDPMDIESIEILKDADATAIYGSRGAAGVVLITTKRGKAGKPTISLRVNQGYNFVSRKFDLLNTQEYLAMRKEAFSNDNMEPTNINAVDLMVWDSTRYTDWQKVFHGNTSRYTDARVQYSGGTESTQFLVSSSYHFENSILPTDLANRRLSNTISFTNKFLNKKGELHASVNYVVDKNELPTTSIAGAIFLAPNAPALYDENGKLNWENGTWTNPLASLNGHFTGKSANLLGNISIQYNILPSLTVKIAGGYNALNTDEVKLKPKTTFNPSSGAKGSAAFGNSANKTWNLEPQLLYKTRIADGRLELQTGATWLRHDYDRHAMFGDDYTSDDLLWNIASAGRITVSNSFERYSYEAIFARLNYNWRDKYVININSRRDGSSRFGPGRKYAMFASVGTAWIFSEEPWMKQLAPVIHFGKLRMSYGSTGNDQIGNYQFLDTYGSGTGRGYEDQTPLVPTALYNPDYQWEVSRKFELGLDLTLFNSRVNLNTSYYLTRLMNQLYSKTLASQTGFNSIYMNQEARFQNSGLELMLQTHNIRKADFRWTTSINFTLPYNKLLSFPGLEKTSYRNQFIVGERFDVNHRAFRYLGIDPQTGVYAFEDVNKDGRISNPEDYLRIHHFPQPFYGGISNTFQYKGFSLDLFIYFARQQARAGYLNSVPGTATNQLRQVIENVWKKPGDIAEYPRLSASSSSNAYKTHILMYQSDARFKDATYMRLRNVALSYRFASSFLKKTGLTGLRIYANGQNIFTSSKYKKDDPETQNANQLPPNRTVILGIEINL